MRVPLRRVTGGIVAFLVALVGVGIVGGTAQASSASSFVSLVNSARHSAGLSSYVVRSDLTAVAQAQAQRMASSGKLYHNPNLATAVKNYSWVGENVGYGPSVSALHAAFMASAGHRANILDHQFTEVGVGIVQVGNTIWVAEVFRRPSGAVSSSPKPKPVVKAKTKVVVKKVVKTAPVIPVRVARTAAKPVAASAAHATARPTPAALPDHVVCSAAAGVADRILDLAGSDRSARLVEQTQHLLIGYQCGAHLPQTGVFDRGTLASLNR